MYCPKTTGKQTNQSNMAYQAFEKNSHLVAKNTKPGKIVEIPLPKNYVRENFDTLSFAYYLRNLPLDTADNTIYSYKGNVISTGGNHYAIVKMDIGKLDLQQCADAVMRLRAEYLYRQKKYNKIHFNFLSDGKPRYYTDFARGDFSYLKFRKYLDYIFTYANTSSLKDEMIRVSDIQDMKPGDVFIQKGKPIGHAVIVADMATEIKTGEKIFLLAQSYMPAQSIHIISNTSDKSLDPWYPLNFKGPLVLPVWTFYPADLCRFK
jgi:hypothetical protein